MAARRWLRALDATVAFRFRGWLVPRRRCTPDERASAVIGSRGFEAVSVISLPGVLQPEVGAAQQLAEADPAGGARGSGA